LTLSKKLWLRRTVGEAILIRADAGPNIGAGHLMRCVALAEAWQKAGGQAVLASAQTSVIPEELSKRISSTVVRVPGETLKDAQATVKAAREAGAKWIVLDGYHFDTTYQEAVESKFSVLLIDDYAHAMRYGTDVILNPNLSASPALYRGKVPGDTGLLLGPQYALLRREFLRYPPRARAIPQCAHNILVTMGAADPHNVTTEIIRALRFLNVGDAEITIVVGAFNPHLETIRSAAKQLACPARVLSNAANMPELMHGSDLAITAGGSTVLELAFMGVPMLAVALAENQVGIAEQVGRCSLGADLGWHDDLTLERVAQTIRHWIDDAGGRACAARSGPSMVDGKGADRVCEVLGK
jgi:UDP-2,4-diacetamido-2,4,6-trideoxy-beta-L-altropyranose hydrolase